MPNKSTLRQIILTFSHRTVMHGYVDDDTYAVLMDAAQCLTGMRFRVYEAALVIQWNSPNGMPSLAGEGPAPAAKISSRAPHHIARGDEINGCWAVSAAAAEVWCSR